MSKEMKEIPKLYVLQVMYDTSGGRWAQPILLTDDPFSAIEWMYKVPMLGFDFSEDGASAGVYEFETPGTGTGRGTLMPYGRSAYRDVPTFEETWHPPVVRRRREGGGWHEKWYDPKMEQRYNASLHAKEKAMRSAAANHAQRKKGSKRNRKS